MNRSTKENEMAEQTTQDRLRELVAAERAKGDAHGIMVRCPVCGVGRGRWCRDENGQTIKHAERVALFNAR